MHAEPGGAGLTTDGSAPELAAGLFDAATNAPAGDAQLPDAAACLSVLVTVLLLLLRQIAGPRTGWAQPGVAAGPAPAGLGRSSRQLLTAIGVLRI